MRAVLIGLALAFIALPVSAQTRDENWTHCTGAGVDADTRIGGCTVLIQSGREISANLAFEYYDRGSAHAQKNLYDEAIADYTQAIAHSPDLYEAYRNRGDIYGVKHLYSLAIADFTKVIALRPDDADAHCSRGLAYEANGSNSQAIADYRTALKLQPKMKDAEDGLQRLGATQ